MATKLWITIDELDGKSVVRGPYHPDEIDTMGLLMRLASQKIATVTFTTADPLRDLKKSLSQRPA